nr:MAG TPA: DNA N-6-adenine-methyltransferase [Caudoviricetes sp.]
MAQGETYEEFVEKFKPKLTTDDCYTPPIVYDAVADWVAAEYKLNRSRFVRPFYPGGDYEAFDYSGGVVVVDNPPFSILAQIVKYYTAHGIPFFLFAPSLTLFRYGDLCTVLAIYAQSWRVMPRLHTQTAHGLTHHSSPIWNPAKYGHGQHPVCIRWWMRQTGQTGQKRLERCLNTYIRNL